MLYVYILSLVFLSLKLYMYCLILQKNNCIERFLKYVANAHYSWFLMNVHPTSINILYLMPYGILCHSCNFSNDTSDE